jgi:hypothetical protein
MFLYLALTCSSYGAFGSLYELRHNGLISILVLLPSMPPTFGYFRSFTSARGRLAVRTYGTGGGRRTLGCGLLVASSVGWLARYAACNDWVHCGQVEAAFKREDKGCNPSKEPGSEDISEKDLSCYILYSPFLIFL